VEWTQERKAGILRGMKPRLVGGGVLGARRGNEISVNSEGGMEVNQVPEKIGGSCRLAVLSLSLMSSLPPLFSSTILPLSLW
jgi:hypothetical protein